MYGGCTLSMFAKQIIKDCRMECVLVGRLK